MNAADLENTAVADDRDPLKILVVEDDNAIAKLITMIIEKSGPYAVERASSIVTAQERLDQGGVDAALLDLELPDSSGIDTVRRICGMHPELPVVVLTSHSESEIAQQALREGAEDFVSKGTSIAIMLDRALRYSLERKRVSRELERQKTLFESVFRDVPDAMVMSDGGVTLPPSDDGCSCAVPGAGSDQKSHAPLALLALIGMLWVRRRR